MVALVMAALVMVASQLLTMRVSINNVQLVNGYRSKPTGYRPGNGDRSKFTGYRLGQTWPICLSSTASPERAFTTDKKP